MKLAEAEDKHPVTAHVFLSLSLGLRVPSYRRARGSLELESGLQVLAVLVAVTALSAWAFLAKAHATGGVSPATSAGSFFWNQNLLQLRDHCGVELEKFPHGAVHLGAGKWLQV